MDSNQTGTPPLSLINWDLAASTAARLTPAGPRMSGAEIAAAVQNLRELADLSVDHVYRITGLEAARNLRDSEVLVVDRATWAKANSQSFRALLQPTLTALANERADQLKAASAALGGTITGGQLGAVLAFLSSKVLGQYDPFAAAAAGVTGAAPSTAGGAAHPVGRLLLVAPNIITVERELNVEPADFRLWVCLHEQTHRVQFAAAPWLRDHMMEQITLLAGSLMDKADTLADRLAAGAKQLEMPKRPACRAERPASGAHGAAAGSDAAAVSDSGAGGDAAGSDSGFGSNPAGVLSLLQKPAEREVFSHLTAVMSLLEGHANVVMDAVDAAIVPSVKTIRRRFNDRGKERGAVEKWIRQLLGLDAKMRQYSDGARFVRAVVAEVGMEGFNHVWERAGNLPTEEEIHNAPLWITRMGI